MKNIFSMAVLVFCSEAKTSDSSGARWKLWITEVNGTHHLPAVNIFIIL